jgi:hypothetical protein
LSVKITGSLARLIGRLWPATGYDERRQGNVTDERPGLDLEPTSARQEQIMRFRAQVEPPEPMRGLEVPQEIVEALGDCKRPRVTITINGHSWKSRVAIMRGRYLLGLSNANRKAAGVVTGDEVEVEVAIDVEPSVVVEPADFARALDA